MADISGATHTSVFPRLIEDDVYLCGFTSPKSYGGMSYFIRHPGGNWLIDSPRFTPILEEKFAANGGLRYIFLTHRDDVADAALYARRFGADRIIHEHDRRAMEDAEIVVKGEAPLPVGVDFTVIPVPGHTRGHCVLHYREKFLFTGDHLEWDPDVDGLNAFRDYCWYDWNEQTRSMEKLLSRPFEWVLPGHGRRQKMPAARMHDELVRLIERMKRA